MKTAIIGGGIGGMITALYLSLEGEEVTIHERQDRLGGRLAYVNEAGFKIDEGPTIILLPEIIKGILKELSVELKELEMVSIDPLYPIHFPDGKVFLKWRDKERQKEEINRCFPGEEVAFERYMNEMEERFMEGKKAFLDHSFIQKRSFWKKENVLTLYRLKAYQTVKKQVESYFQSKCLREAFSLQTLYIGGSPSTTPALYSLVPYSEHEHGVWYLKGGYARLAEILTKELEKRNIVINYNSSVTKVYKEKDRATALECNGKIHPYERFILNGDFPLSEKLLYPKEKKSRKYIPSSGTVVIYLGLNGRLNTNHVHQFFMGDDLEGLMKEVFVEKSLPLDPSFYVFHPSLIDESLAPAGKSVAYVLIPVPSSSTISQRDYESLAEKVLVRLTKQLDLDLDKKIIWKKFRTPLDAQQEGLFGVGSFGIAPTLFQSGVFRPQVKPFPLDNVYAVGASVHPGGGVPIVMQGAKILANVIRSEREGESEHEQRRSV
ncbi:phytoene desaturase family protein [Evansella tamaricis]|uniref:Phytoene desaturase n=1 Tax=Evansella tamaricis TaxID=2069301 RepID=A0ABS6JR14_9BACI|nr:phytoene desaturase family protein [Evansella tamaricis]MBU9714743.1 phytoene desaturase [Evansella tamaricis]